MSLHNSLMARLAAGTVLLVAPDRASEVEACLNAAASHPRAQELLHGEPNASNQDFWYPKDDWRSTYRPYVVEDGVLQIPVKGVLLNDFGWALGNYATGYEYIWKAFERGLADDEVTSIAFIINSPGGLVAGNFELVDKIYAKRGEKPIYSVASDYAYSAAYSIASVADPGNLWMSRTGGVGSIGVVVSHYDMSAAYEQMGVKITFIHFGKHKVDGNSAEPLKPEVRAKIQSRIDELGEIFVSTVARNRGLSEDEVRATEAATFTASEATSNGLADKISSLEDAVSAIAGDLSTNEGDDQMSTQDTAAANEAAITAAREEGRKQGYADGHAVGLTEGATAENSRLTSVLALEEAKDRPALALKLATTPGMTADTAKGILEVAAKETQELPAAAEQQPAGSALDRAMEGTGGGAGVAPESGQGQTVEDDPVALARQYGLAASFVDPA